MKSYQIYIKGIKRNGEPRKRFKNGGILNLFFSKEEAIKRAEKLHETWDKIIPTYETKIVEIDL